MVISMNFEDILSLYAAIFQNIVLRNIEILGVSDVVNI